MHNPVHSKFHARFCKRVSTNVSTDKFNESSRTTRITRAFRYRCGLWRASRYTYRATRSPCVFSKVSLRFYLHVTCESAPMTRRSRASIRTLRVPRGDRRVDKRVTHAHAGTYADPRAALYIHKTRSDDSLPLGRTCHDLHYFLATRRRNSSINLLFEKAISATGAFLWSAACARSSDDLVPRRRRRPRARSGEWRRRGEEEEAREKGRKVGRDGRGRAGKAIHRELAYRCLIHLT